MPRTFTGTSPRRAAPALLALALAAALVAAARPPAAGTAAPSPGALELRGPWSVPGGDGYYNPVAPRLGFEGVAVEKAATLGGKGARVTRKPAASVAERSAAFDRKFSGGFPRAARQLGAVEALAARTGRNPSWFKRAPETQVARLLTVLVEFNPNAGDDFSGFRRPAFVGAEECVTEPEGTRISGPVHNNLPNPAAVGRGTDNNTFWVPDFSPAHYEKLIYSTTGLTQRVRKDLTGPDGKPGVDLRGYTVRNMYREMSKGAYDITGEVVGWVQVPHSEAWYGAGACGQPMQDHTGHPDNPRGVQQLVVDAVNAIAAQQPDFPWEDYDLEDQGDLDGDGNLFEPDGVIDHFVMIHAGADKADGGGEQGTYAIWSHAGTVDPAAGGYTIPGTGIKAFNYIVQAEDAGVGVIAHEYGHDLGLPDLYDTSGAADSDVEFWDLMSTGSHSGPLFQTIPTHMGLWDKFVLGWADPVTFNPGDRARHVLVGQSSRTPRLTADGVRVNLPPKVIDLADPHSGGNMWYSGNDQDWADVKIARTVEVPAGSDVRFWVWNNYVIEELWDYGFIEVSTDGGGTWTQLEVRDEAGNVVSTNDDPNGRLQDYGGLRNGLTGDTHGWRHDWVDLTPYAGQTIGLRLRYATDAAFLERGWFADDFAITADGATVWSDDAESGTAGWTAQRGTFTTTQGNGWSLTSGTFVYEHYYLAEWRNLDGFDRGLAYTYDTTWTNGPFANEWRVERVPYNAPGLLVWYRDGQFTVNHVSSFLSQPPSHGAKGSLLIVDSHFDPLRRSGEAAERDPTTLKNIPSRPQAANAAFGLKPTPAFQECIEDPPGSYQAFCTQFGGQAPVRSFTDAKGWYPGLELRGEDLFYRDFDASVVVPSRGNQLYSTRIVDPDGNPRTDLYGLDLGGGIVLGSGNPADGNPAEADPQDASLGVSFSVQLAGPGNTFALVRVAPARG